MIGHDHPGMNQQSFIIDAVIKAVAKDIPVTLSGKNVSPLNDSRGKKIQLLLISDPVGL
jgi:hypothetical protein